MTESEFNYKPTLRIAVSLNRRQVGAPQDFYPGLVNKRLPFNTLLIDASPDAYHDETVAAIIVRPNIVLEVYPDTLDMIDLTGRIINLKMKFPYAQIYIDAGRWVGEIKAYVEDPVNRESLLSTDITFHGVIVSPDSAEIILHLNDVYSS
jgi:hypothetical protein